MPSKKPNKKGATARKQIQAKKEKTVEAPASEPDMTMENTTVENVEETVTEEAVSAVEQTEIQPQDQIPGITIYSDAEIDQMNGLQLGPLIEQVETVWIAERKKIEIIERYGAKLTRRSEIINTQKQEQWSQMFSPSAVGPQRVQKERRAGEDDSPYKNTKIAIAQTFAWAGRNAEPPEGSVVRAMAIEKALENLKKNIAKNQIFPAAVMEMLRANELPTELMDYIDECKEKYEAKRSAVHPQTDVRATA